MEVTLEPNVGMSSFKLGEKIDEYIKMYPFNYIKAEETESWDEYDFFDDLIEVYVDKETSSIESIACRGNCYYKGINLIDYEFDNFLELINKKKNELVKEKLWLENDEQQTVYELSDMLLQIWVNSKNKIQTIFIG